MRVVIVSRGGAGRRSGAAERVSITLEALRGVADVDVVLLTRDAATQELAETFGCRVTPVRALQRRTLPTDVVLALAGWRPRRMLVGRYGRQRMLVHRAIGLAPDVIWTVGARAFLALPPRLVLQVPVVADLVDFEDERNVALARQAVRWRSLKMFLARREQAGLRRLFHRIARQSSVALLASSVDASRLGSPRVAVLPNGYRRPGMPVGILPRAPHPTFAFAGLFSYRPNADGVRWLVRDIWPLVRTALPDAELRLVGAGLPDAVFAHESGVKIVGPVAEMPPALTGAWACLAPLRSGAGTRIKILEAWAHRMPVVSTTIGAEGLGGGHERELLVADEAADFAREIVRVATDQSLAQRLADHGERRWREHFSPEVVGREVRAVLARAVSRNSVPKPGEDRDQIVRWGG